MHYEVGGHLLKTENAAKHASQSRRFVVDLLESIAPDTVALDYGCGKLRYTLPLSSTFREVHAVDSTEQLEREQVVAGSRTSVDAYVQAHLPNVTTHPVDGVGWRERRYGFILCSDVLPIVPCTALRAIILRELGGLLESDGELLVTTRYYHGSFASYEDRPGAQRHLDGWILPAPRPSFFGIIGIEQLKALCEIAGLRVTKAFTRDHSAYVFATAESASSAQ